MFVRTGDGGFASSRFVLGLRARDLLSVSGPHRRRVAGSASIVFVVPRGGTLHVRLNGRPVDSTVRLVRFHTWEATLGANDGLRFGRNTVTIQNFREDDGRYDVERLTVIVSKTRPLVGAGLDRSTSVDDSVRLDGHSSRPSRKGNDLSYRWEIVSGPSTAPSAVRLGATAAPIVEPPEHGLYRLRLVVTEQTSAGAVSASDVVDVDAVPNDMPIGATIDTIGVGGRPTIAGKAVANTGQGINVVVLRRSDRQLLFSANYHGSDKAAMDAAAASVRTWTANAPRSLVIITGTSGLQGDAVPSLDDVLRLIGGNVDGVAGAMLQQGKAFSVIGVPKAPDGAAFQNFGWQTQRDATVGNLSGYLQLSTASFEYGFVFPDFRSFDTRTEHSGTESAMQIAGTRYGDTLPEGSAGFHVVVVDRHSLVPFQDSDDCNITLPEPPCPHDFNEAIPINTGNVALDRQYQVYFASHLEKFGLQRPNALVFLQTIGNPKPTTTAWNGIADVVYRLGGTRTLFNELSTGGEYALVGGPGLTPSEASTRFGLDTVHVTGALGRNRQSGFEAAVADSFEIETKLLRVLYQSPQPFPAFTAAQREAERYLAQRPELHLKGDSVRANYWNENYAADWNNKKGLLDQVPFPSGQTKFTLDDFTTAREELDQEIGALNDVKNYFANLERPLFDSQLSSYVSLKNIGQQVVQTVSVPPDSGGLADAHGLFAQAVSGAGSLFEDTNPELATALTAYSVLIQVLGRISAPGGEDIVGQVRARASDLADQLVTRLQLSRDALEGLGKIVVSDYGKLMAVRAFDLNSPVQAGIAMNKGAKRWFLSELMPFTWATWELRDVATAADWYCFRPSADDEPVDPSHYFIFRSEPATGQYRPILSFNTDLSPDKSVLRALGVHGTFPGYGNDRSKPPPASLTDAIFSPIDNNIQTNNLGLYPEVFYERNFTRRSPPMSQSPGDDCYRR